MHIVWTEEGGGSGNEEREIEAIFNGNPKNELAKQRERENIQFRKVMGRSAFDDAELDQYVKALVADGYPRQLRDEETSRLKVVKAMAAGGNRDKSRGGV